MNNRPVGLLRRWPELHTETLALLAGLYFTLACNLPFWSALLAGRDPWAPATWGLALCTALFITAGQVFLLLLVLNRWTARPLLVTLAAVTAAAVYFMARLHVYPDPAMMRNVLETDRKEAAELLTPHMLPWLLAYALLPALLLWRVRVKRSPGLRAVARRAGALALSLLVMAGSLWAVMDTLVPTLREQRELRYLITPSNVVYSLFRATTREVKEARTVRHAVGTDAVQDAAPGRRPRVFVVVVGETVRAANWGLDGYARQTTPALAVTPGVINFADVRSCGTNTEVSVPCMFSPDGRENYDEERIRTSESLLHVLHHAGIHVLWRDNQSGCKGVCAGLPVENFFDARIDGLCANERCMDGILLHDLAGRIDNTPGDLFVVLHMLGNHGPAYFRRYPPEFRRFMPTCDTDELDRCSHEEIVNSYDNAVLYTDHVLAQAISLLGNIHSHDSALLYLSDHGESLGENNLFLHSLPYAIAPDTQTRVPMMLWLSPGLAATSGMDTDCLRVRARQPASHDNLFHTALGMMDVRTGVYRRDLDLTAGCRH